MTDPVRLERNGPVTTVIINRPEARNAVNGAVAAGLEAALGALYLDGGLDPARRFIHRGWGRAMVEQAEPPKDPKSALQEWAHKRLRAVPVYAVTKRSGPPHAPEFTGTVTAADHSGVGIAGSTQAAEQAAAAALLGSLTA